MIQNSPLIQCARISCMQGNDAVLACSRQNCKQNAFICNDIQCKCASQHKNCSTLNINEILKSLQQFKVKQISQKTQLSISFIENLYDEIIEKISNMREKFIDESEYFGLHPKSIQLVKKLNNGFMDEITGSIINQVQKEITKTQVIDLLPIPQIQSLWRRHEKHFDKLREVFDQISRKITMRNYQIEQKLIKKSQQQPQWGKAIIDNETRQSFTVAKWFNLGRAIQQITILNLNGLKIRQIPQQIALLSELRELNLRDNLISEIKNVENLEYLKTINLSWNEISQLSISQFQNCKNLKQVLVYNRKNPQGKFNFKKNGFQQKMIFVGI